MSRFTSRVRGDLDENATEPDTVDVQARAMLALTLHVVGAQRTVGRFVLVTETRSETGAHGPSEVFVGVDGESGEPVEITVSYPDSGD